jgi:DNA-binding GntR family transcriptional regulator
MTGIPVTMYNRKKLGPMKGASVTPATSFRHLTGERTTVSERVYFEFRTSIANGEFKPGQPLIVRNLAAAFNVSRTPIIEAIRRLERDGLVKVAPKWGATVKEWHWDEIEEAIYIRRAMESEAAWLFVERATPDAKRELTRLNEFFNQCVTNGSLVGRQDADIDLHLHIARSTRFPRLYELVENSSIERIAIVGLSTKRAQEKECPHNDFGVHDILVKELLGQDQEAARAAMVAHVDDSFVYIAGSNKPKSSERPVVTSI